MNRHFPALFATDEWKQGIGLPLPERAEFLRELYDRQLRQVGGFSLVRSFGMVAEGGQTSYYLVYGTRHPKGLQLMKRAMWAVDTSGSYQFSARLAGQQVLFSGDRVDTGPLRAAILQRFAGRTSTIEEIEEFVLLDTPFLHDTHLKRATLKRMEQEEDPSPIAYVAGRRRPGTYPAGCRITFAAESQMRPGEG